MLQFNGNIEITPAAVAESFSPDIFVEAECRQSILAQLHPAGPVCPDCGDLLKGEGSISNFWAGERVVCANCNKYYSARTGTVLAGSAMQYRELYFMLLLIGLNIPLQVIAKQLGVHTVTVRRWRDRLCLLPGGTTA